MSLDGKSSEGKDNPSDKANHESKPRQEHRWNQRGGRGRGSWNEAKQRTKFEGREPELKGFIYDVTEDKTPGQYIQTTKEIVIFVGRRYNSYTTELVQAVEQLKLADPTAPPDPDPANLLQLERVETPTA
jgi:hypothetical protein